MIQSHGLKVIIPLQCWCLLTRLDNNEDHNKKYAGLT
jgi:hypothetical protein